MAMDQSLEIPFIGMNIHLPAILVFTMGIGFLTHIQIAQKKSAEIPMCNPGGSLPSCGASLLQADMVMN